MLWWNKSQFILEFRKGMILCGAQVFDNEQCVAQRGKGILM